MVSIDKIQDNVKKLKQVLPSLNIDSIFLEQNNQKEVVFYREETMHEVRSCSKILVAMAVGIAIDKGLLIDDVPFSLNTKVYPVFNKIASITNKANIEKIKKWTIRDLLLHTTGYEKQMLSESMIKDIDKDTLLEYALNYDMPFDVGDHFVYNNVEPFLLSVFFQEAFHINLSEFIKENIFDKIGILEYKWNNYGKYCPGATGLFLKHSDFHKIGKLLLNDGCYNGKQVIPMNWIKEMCSLQMETPSMYKKERVLPKIGVGYYTFISRDNFVFRDGANGQYIIINQEKNILITIMSTEKEMNGITEILRDII